MDSAQQVGLLEQFLFQKSVFVILFDADLRVVYHNFPKAVRAGRLDDFLFLLGPTTLDRIRQELGGARSGTEVFDIDQGAVGFQVRRLSTGFFSLEILGPRESNPVDQDLGRADEQSADYKRLRDLLSDVQALGSGPAPDRFLQELRAFRRKYPGNEVLDLSLGIIETNLLELADQAIGLSPAVLRMLTPSELQVAEFIRRGKSTKEIADALSIAAKTVENHRNNLRTKLGLANTRANLQTYLVSLGEGSPEVPRT